MVNGRVEDEKMGTVVDGQGTGHLAQRWESNIEKGNKNYRDKESVEMYVSMVLCRKCPFHPLQLDNNATERQVHSQRTQLRKENVEVATS